MAVRTTSELVEGIIEVEDGISLTPFISAASALVAQCCTGDAVSEDYADALLLEIETWLAAHVYTIRDMRAEAEKAGSVSQKLQSKVDLGFDTSHYGQMAMRLDWQGGLASLNEQIKKGIRKIIGVTWLGTEKDTESS